MQKYLSTPLNEDNVRILLNGLLHVWDQLLSIKPNTSTTQSTFIVHRAANSVDSILNGVDNQMQTWYELAATSKPDITNDVTIIVKTLVEAGALTDRSCRSHTQYRTTSQEIFAGVITNMAALQKWLFDQQSKVVKEFEYNTYKN